ncbi:MULTISPECIES: carboxypeptidase-like regulatory domain-containing protein [Sanguibacteroides]|uniref:PEGA domain-containing protein n=1 Tax=Sanguibacteroides justesenii TaxID=1547597 RepID=A0A0C3RG69_9PORP|nr:MULTISPECIES: carboxypeptidase-like regulatory domain-containing protein [Sanguibacteroides]KIO43737.1 hypothetical protein IE90_11535 [Sanguibacteroides justesenii]KIO45901.1 hypothetical protein BA92_05495 [Sanguibacteroides justesenii]PXZ45018.1 hypothetical protein DMB45_00810 [Sanguibacteroides justesenii]
MRKFLKNLVLVTILFTGMSFTSSEKSIERAKSVMITVLVVDNQSNPIEGATVWINDILHTSDTSGEVMEEMRIGANVSIEVEKEGYHKATTGFTVTANENDNVIVVILNQV